MTILSYTKTLLDINTNIRKHESFTTQQGANKRIRELLKENHEQKLFKYSDFKCYEGQKLTK